eukprot:2415737-Rhodomonas_salina.3
MLSVLAWAKLLRFACTMSGTDLGYGASGDCGSWTGGGSSRVASRYRPTRSLCNVRYWHTLCSCEARSGTNAMLLRVCYALARHCAVLA